MLRLHQLNTGEVVMGWEVCGELPVNLHDRRDGAQPASHDGVQLITVVSFPVPIPSPTIDRLCPISDARLCLMMKYEVHQLGKEQPSCWSLELPKWCQKAALYLSPCSALQEIGFIHYDWILPAPVGTALSLAQCTKCRLSAYGC